MKNKIDKLNFILGFLVLALFFSSAVWFVTKTKFTQDRLYASVDLTNLAQRIQSDEFYGKVKPILDSRCVTCHSCFNSPCQLNLSSYEGVERGANKENIYDFGILSEKNPTRLSIDAPTKDIWQSRYFNFYPVINQKKEKSILYHVLNNKSPVPAGNEFNAEESRICSRYNNTEQFLVYMYTAQANNSGVMPQWAQMPFGFPPVSSQENQTLMNWISKGSNGPDPSLEAVLRQPHSESTRSAIARWEFFFNGDQFRSPSGQNSLDFKTALTSRYIYEHLFLAHIHFEENNPREFYRLIRAENAIGEPVEIPTRRPNDDPNDSNIFPWKATDERRKPGQPFYYRFKKVTQTLTHKFHLPFSLNDQKLELWRQMFHQTNWNIKNNQELLDYSVANAANPFALYRAIPEKVRYQFLLDDSYFFVMSFIKGPVCRGQTALDVIDDNFWVFFMNPNSDVLVQNPNFVNEAKDDLSLPIEKQGPLELFDLWEGSLDRLRVKKQAVLNATFKGKGLSSTDIWNGSNYFGQGENPNSILTVYRHFDSASVSRGALGQQPKTFWVMDYLIFEDIYYNLVANYDVFGNVIHQVFTRHHMGTSRISSQDLFISFMPKNLRSNVRAQWNRDKNPKMAESESYDWCKRNSLFLWACEMQQNLFTKSASRKMSLKYVYGGYSGDNQHSLGVHEFVSSLLKQNSSQTSNRMALNLSSETEKELSRLTEAKGRFANLLPELSYLRITDSRTGERKWYSMVHNREHFNVAFFFETPEQLDLDHDSIDILPAFVGSYVNAIFDIQSDELPVFVSRILTIKEELDMNQLYQKYLVSRYEKADGASRFWKFFDELNAEVKRQDPIEGAIIDLNRYVNK